MRNPNAGVEPGDLADILDAIEATDKPIAIERGGKPVAAIVPWETLQRLEREAAARNQPLDPPEIPISDTASFSQLRLLKTALEFGQLGAWIWDNHVDRLVYCSPELAALFDTTPEEYIQSRGTSESLNRMIHPDDTGHYKRVVSRATSSGERYSVEFRQLSLDGTYRHIREVGDTLFEGQEPGRYLFGILQDATDLKDAERALRESEAELRRAQHLAKVGTWRWDAVKSETKSCSPEYARILGIAQEDAATLSKDFAPRLVHPDDQARVTQVLQNAAATPHTTYRMEFRIIRPNGQVRHVLRTGEPVRDGDGHVIERKGILQDVTDLKQAEAELERAQQQARVGSWRWNMAERRLVYCSNEYARILGSSAGEIANVARNVVEWRVHPEDRERVQRVFDENFCETGRGYRLEFRVVLPDGEVRHVLEISDPVLDAQGKLVEHVGTIQDVTKFKNTEIALRRSEAELKKAQRQARVGSWRWDVRNRRLISCSEEFSRILGRPAVDVQTLSETFLSTIVHPDDRARVSEEFARFAKLGMPFRTEYRIVHPDGSVRHLLDMGEPVMDETGRMVEQSGIVQDITERVRMEEALMRSHEELERRVHERTRLLELSEARYRQIFEGAAVGIGRARYRDGRMILSNQRLASMFGYDDVNAFVEDFVLSDNCLDPKEGRRLAEAYKSDPTQPLESTFRKRNGDTVTVQVHALINYDEDHVDFVCIDVTDRKRAERALKESEQSLQGLLDNSPNLISIKDLDGRFTFLNKQYEKEFGLDTRISVGKSGLELFPAETMERVADHERMVVETGLPVTLQEIGLRVLKDREMDFICCKFPMFDADGNIAGIASIRTDITEHRATTQRLEQAQKLQAIGQLTGGIAHDFNNLLSVIRVNSELLEHRLGEDDRSVRAVLRATTSASNLIERLLSFARKQRLRPGAVDVPSFVAEVTELLHESINQDIVIETDVQDGVWPIYADASALETALVNLAFNACDAMPDGGRLTFECRNDTLEEPQLPSDPAPPLGDFVVFTVRDTGLGMSADILARACEPFFTTKEPQGTSTGGTGLGLSMVYGFVRQSGGYFHIESREGKATAVSFGLPRSSRKVELAEAGDEPARAEKGRGELVLVVEDDRDLSAALDVMLHAYGYRTATAVDPSAALDMLAEMPDIDLVLSDVTLPGEIDGIELVQRLRRDHPGTPFLLMSGRADAAELRAIRAGFDVPIIRKPFHGHDLARALRKALSESASKSAVASV